MKFGAHSYMFTDRWTDDCVGFLDTAADLGLQCFEIGVGDDVPFAAEATARRARNLGIELTVGPGGLWPTECDLSSDDPAGRLAGLRWHKKIVDRAHELEAVAYCGSIYGHTGVVRYRRPPRDEYPRTAEGLHELAEYARAKGVAVVLEPMSHFRTHMVNNPRQVMRLIDLADHPNLGVCFDTFHMMTEVRDWARGLRTIGKRLWGLHTCENDRGVPGGGLVPWDDVFGTLVETDFDGYVLMETYNSSLEDFALRRGMFHDVCPHPLDFIERGLKFLTAGFARAAKNQPRHPSGRA